MAQQRPGAADLRSADVLAPFLGRERTEHLFGAFDSMRDALRVAEHVEKALKEAFGPELEGALPRPRLFDHTGDEKKPRPWEPKGGKYEEV